ncbi:MULTISPECIES: TonB-dependent receptor [Thermodesulfovibrio]|jgi:outer membrane receptor protein involved in Fe transport|uniref:TonB-dependent receptor n=1 Tax=Thermodesulfovibrio TaxID=28261 RepID=UPI00260ED4D3|nr:TonB-dependent receptor [Thermodesulfovibrio sp.]
MKKIIFFCIVFILITSSYVFCQDKNEDFKLKEITVTESKIEQLPQEQTHKIDIVDKREIETINLPNRNLSELIKYLPGNFVNPLSRNDANWGSYGGLGPKYNSWLLDGLPIDSFVDPMSLDFIYLDRIEVHRGPASVLYPNYMTMDFAGNETPLAGITNLITKDKIEKPYTNISLGYGTWNTINARIYHEGNAGPFNFFLGANYEQSDYTNYGTKPSWLNMIDDPEYKKIKGYFKTTYFFTPETKLSLFVHHTKHDGDAGRPHRGYDHQYDVVNLNFSTPLFKDFIFSAKAGYRYYHRSWEEDKYDPPKSYDLSLREEDGVKQNIFPFDLSINYKHFGKSVLTAGIDSQFSTYETYAKVGGNKSIDNDVNAKSFGIYAQEKLIIDKWVLRAGLRYAYTKHDYDKLGGVKPEVSSKSWDQLLWSAGVRYNFTDNFGIFANAGSSYLVPSAKSVGGTIKESDRGVSGKNGQLPNPNLKPEKGYSFDLGADLWALSNLYFSLRGFYHITKDTIVENKISDTPSQTQSVNAGKAYTKGAEFEVQHFISDKFKWFSNLTLTDTEVKNSLDKNQDGSEISFVPDFIANAGFTANLPYGFTISPYFQYVGKYYDSTDKTKRKDFGDYSTVNLNIKKELFRTDKYYSNLILEINNLFDKKYEMPWQFQDPGFNAMLKWELNF